MKILSILLIVLFVACAPPRPDPSLEADQVRLWQANQAVTILGTLQRTAIRLHSEKTLSEKNTRTVVVHVTESLRIIKGQPDSWRPVSYRALDTIDKELDRSGHTTLDKYIITARTQIEGL